MNRKIILVVFLLAAAGTWFISGCKKDASLNEPAEPISLVSPDTAIVRLFAGDTLPLEIKFTTDRPINWVKGLYDVDLTGSVSYSPTYPNTLFNIPLDTMNPRVNLYTYKGVYRIPDSLPAFSVVYLDVLFEAGNATFTTGQNFPAGIVTGEKRFKINVR